MCTLAFAFVDFHMFFVFCTYAKRVVSGAISANVVGSKCMAALQNVE
jgi:hypothetical protein